MYYLFLDKAAQVYFEFLSILLLPPENKDSIRHVPTSAAHFFSLD